MNTLSFETDTALFLYRCTKDSRHPAKEAGWGFDPRDWKDPVWHCRRYEKVAALLDNCKRLDIALKIEDCAKKEIRRYEADRKERLDRSWKTNSAFKIPAPDGLSYYPFQRAGIDYAIRNKNTLIADEMGLGKTIQAIGVINYSKPKKVLIVVPASLKLNWAYELKRWLVHDYSISVIDGSSDFTKDIIVINYDRLREKKEKGKDVERSPELIEILKYKYDLLICDESHYIKNYKAQRTKGVVAASKCASRKLFLTGTPILNRPVELYTPLAILGSELGGMGWFNYVTKYCGGHQKWAGRRKVWDVSGATNLKELNEKLRSTVMVRRLKKDVMTELPAKTRSIIPLEVDDVYIQAALDAEKEAAGKWKTVKEALDQSRKLVNEPEESKVQKFEDQVRNLSNDVMHAFTEIAVVRHKTAPSKVPQTMSFIRDVLETQDKVVVFTHHKDVLRAIKAEFEDMSVELTGETGFTARDDAIRMFQEEKHIRLFFGTTQAAGLGITLTAASAVVFIELEWTPSEMAQAEDRCLSGKELVYCPQTVYNKSMSIKSIADINVGDTVLTHTGKEKIVLATKQRTNVDGRMTKILYVGWHLPIECTFDHKFLVQRKDSDGLNWIQAHRILPGDSLILPRSVSGRSLGIMKFSDSWRRYPKKASHCIIDGCTNPIEARQRCRIHYRSWLSNTPVNKRQKGCQYTNSKYIRLPDEFRIDHDWLFVFGWFVAEGFTSISNNKGDFVSLSGHENERKILERCGNTFRRLGINWTIYVKKNSKAIELRAYSTELARWFRSWFGNGAGNKRLPKEIMELPKKQAKIVLNAYVLGDGYSRDGCHEWVSKSMELCYQFCILAAKCGYAPTFRRGSKQSGMHYIGGYCDATKTELPYILRKVRTVESYYERRPKVYDITVEEDSSFVTGFATAHNCHRIGQRYPVNVYHLVIDESIDAELANMLIDKQKVIDEALDDELDLEPMELEDIDGRTDCRSAGQRRLDSIAKRLTEDEITAIHAALRALARVCDGAIQEDGVGFNGVDTQVGHKLAAADRLTPRQAAWGYVIHRKYHRQLGDKIVTLKEEG